MSQEMISQIKVKLLPDAIKSRSSFETASGNYTFNMCGVCVDIKNTFKQF